MDWKASHFVGHHLALDFVNTIGDRHERPWEDRIATPEALASWCGAALAFHDRPPVPDGPVTLTDDGVALVRDLRESLLASVLDRRTGASPDGTQMAALYGRVHEGLATGGIGFADPGTGAAAAVLLRLDDPAVLGFLAWQGIDVLTRVPPRRLGACPRCGWVFRDITKAGRRRWCSMAACGNREKARRHRAAGTQS